MTNGVNCPNRLARRRRRVYLLPPAEGDRKKPALAALFHTGARNSSLRLSVAACRANPWASHTSTTGKTYVPASSTAFVPCVLSISTSLSFTPASPGASGSGRCAGRTPEAEAGGQGSFHRHLGYLAKISLSRSSQVCSMFSRFPIPLCSASMNTSLRKLPPPAPALSSAAVSPEVHRPIGTSATTC